MCLFSCTFIYNFCTIWVTFLFNPSGWRPCLIALAFPCMKSTRIQLVPFDPVTFVFSAIWSISWKDSWPGHRYVLFRLWLNLLLRVEKFSNKVSFLHSLFHILLIWATVPISCFILELLCKVLEIFIVNILFHGIDCCRSQILCRCLILFLLGL